MEIDVKALAGSPQPAFVSCKICSTEAELFDVVDFQKFCSSLNPYRFGVSGVPVYYHRCGSCGFAFTNFMDDWSGADFARHVYNDDYILVDPEYAGDRPVRMAEHFANLVKASPDTSMLDYGAGGGAFKTELGQRGFPLVEEYDPFSHPVRPTGTFDIVFASEVVEHSPDPIATFKDMASFLHEDGIILFSTALQPENFETIRAGWWYVGPRNGHISIFSRGALDFIAQSFGMELFFAGGWQAFARSPVDLERFGINHYQEREITLRAPAESQPGWHGVETHAGTAHRWTAEERITWQLPGVQCRTKFILSVPYGIEAAKDFAKQHSISVNGKTLPVEVVRKENSWALIASAEVKPGEKAMAELTVPKLTGPEGRGNADPRKLGLLIPVE